MSETDLQHLHGRATRDQTLSDQEQAALDAWYAQHDQREIKALTRALPAVTTHTLQAQLDTTLRQLEVVAHQIRQAASDNTELRREIGLLQRQLAQLAGVHPET
jgi:hypothetical protein